MQFRKQPGNHANESIHRGYLEIYANVYLVATLTCGNMKVRYSKHAAGNGQSVTYLLSGPIHQNTYMVNLIKKI